jgi:Protein of unknown function (DUF2798)
MEIKRMQSNPPRPPRAPLRFPKLPPRYAGIVLPLLLSAFMTCIVSMVSTLRGIGLAPHLFTIWVSAWGLSWAVAFPTLLLVMPLMRRATAALVDVGRGESDGINA